MFSRLDKANVSHNGISTHFENIKITIELPRPQNVKRFKASQDIVGILESVIYMYDVIAKSLYGLTMMFF